MSPGYLVKGVSLSEAGGVLLKRRNCHELTAEKVLGKEIMLIFKQLTSGSAPRVAPLKWLVLSTKVTVPRLSRTTCIVN